MFRIFMVLALLLPSCAAGCASEQSVRQADDYAQNGGVVPPRNTFQPVGIIR